MGLRTRLFTNASYGAATARVLPFSRMYAVRVPALATRMVEIWNMTLHKIRARSEQRGPQGHTGLARTSSESHRMGTERRHLDYKGKKSNTTRPRAFPPPNPIHDLANQIATAPSRRKPRRQVDFQPAGTPLDCARLREGGMVAVCRNRVSKA